MEKLTIRTRELLFLEVCLLLPSIHSPPAASFNAPSLQSTPLVPWVLVIYVYEHLLY